MCVDTVVKKEPNKREKFVPVYFVSRKYVGKRP